MAASPWLLLQLADSAFPAGGFVHSLGIEASLASGLVGDGPGRIDVAALAPQIAWQVGWAALPFVRAGHRGEPALAVVDARADAFLLSPVANRASRAQGRALVGAARRVWDGPEVAAIAAAAAVGHVHHAPFFGALGRALSVELDDTLALFLHGAMRGALSAAVRLGIAGPLEAQRVQAAAAPVLDAVRARCRDLDLDDAAQTHPLLDLHGALHDTLGARMFQS